LILLDRAAETGALEVELQDGEVEPAVELGADLAKPTGLDEAEASHLIELLKSRYPFDAAASQ